MTIQNKPLPLLLESPRDVRCDRFYLVARSVRGLSCKPELRSCGLIIATLRCHLPVRHGAHSHSHVHLVELAALADKPQRPDLVFRQIEHEVADDLGCGQGGWI